MKLLIAATVVLASSVQVAHADMCEVIQSKLAYYMLNVTQMSARVKQIPPEMSAALEVGNMGHVRTLVQEARQSGLVTIRAARLSSEQLHELVNAGCATDAQIADSLNTMVNLEGAAQKAVTSVNEIEIKLTAR